MRWLGGKIVDFAGLLLILISIIAAFRAAKSDGTIGDHLVRISFTYIYWNKWVAITFYLIFSLFGVQVQLFGRRIVGSTVNFDRVTKKDVIFLRPFSADKPNSAIPGWKIPFTKRQIPLLKIIGLGYTTEEEIQYAVRKIGKMKASGGPVRKILGGTAGAEKINLPNGNWRGEVTSWINEAGLIIILIGIGEHIIWELEQVGSCIPLERVVLLVPYDGGRYYRDFLGRLKAIGKERSERERRGEPVEELDFPVNFPHYAAGESVISRMPIKAAIYFESKYQDQDDHGRAQDYYGQLDYGRLQGRYPDQGDYGLFRKRYTDQENYSRIQRNDFNRNNYTAKMVRFDLREGLGPILPRTEAAFVYELKSVYEKLSKPWPGYKSRRLRNLGLIKRTTLPLIFSVTVVLLAFIYSFVPAPPVKQYLSLQNKSGQCLEAQGTQMELVTCGDPKKNRQEDWIAFPSTLGFTLRQYGIQQCIDDKGQPSTAGEAARFSPSIKVQENWFTTLYCDAPKPNYTQWALYPISDGSDGSAIYSFKNAHTNYCPMSKPNDLVEVICSDISPAYGWLIVPTRQPRCLPSTAVPLVCWDENPLSAKSCP